MGTDYEEADGVTVVEVAKDSGSAKGDPRALDGRSLTVSKKKPTLTEKEKAFVPLYADGEFKGNAFGAACAAGYSTSYAKSKAHELAKKPHIVAAVNAYIIGNHRPTSDPVVLAMHERLIKIAKFDVASLFETTDDPKHPAGLKMRDLATITPLLTREEAASFLGIKPQTLAAWSSSGRHRIPHAKVGNRCRYRLSDLEEFCTQRTQDNVGDTVVAECPDPTSCN